MVVAMRERTEQPEASRRVQAEHEHGRQNRPGRERRERARAKEERRGPGV